MREAVQIDQKPAVGVRPEDILTPRALAKRLKVSTSWVFEQTRTRAKVRNKNPLPCHKIGKFLRFYWPEVADWLLDNKE